MPQNASPKSPTSPNSPTSARPRALTSRPSRTRHVVEPLEGRCLFAAAGIPASAASLSSAGVLTLRAVRGTNSLVQVFPPDSNNNFTVNIAADNTSRQFLFNATQVRTLRVFGTQRPDVINVSSPARTFVYGFGGNDNITVADQNAYVDAGQGDDNIFAGNGNDILLGGQGNDTILTGNGNSAIDGGQGNDTVTTGNGNNIVSGGSGDDSLTTGSGVDILYGGAGNDTLTSGAGNDTLYGNAGTDLYNAGSGSNLVVALVGSNTISASPAAGDVNYYVQRSRNPNNLYFSPPRTGVDTVSDRVNGRRISEADPRRSLFSDRSL